MPRHNAFMDTSNRTWKRLLTILFFSLGSDTEKTQRPFQKESVKAAQKGLKPKLFTHQRTIG